MLRLETDVFQGEDGELFAYVAEFIEPKERNLFDQPPFSWVVNSDALFPLGIFGDVESYDEHVRRARLTMALAAEVRLNHPKGRYYSPSSTRVMNTERLLASSVNITREDCRTYFFPTIAALQTLYNEYPYLEDYLNERYGTSDFTEDGSPTAARLRQNWKLRTYATFAFEREQFLFNSEGRYLGLEEVLPYLATAWGAGEISLELPEEHHSINPQSKFFRVVRSGLLG